MALTLGTLVGYLELDARGLDRGAATGRRTMERLAADITRITERAATDAGDVLADTIVRAARQAGQQAPDQIRNGLSNLGQVAERAAREAGQEIEAGLSAGARQAGQEAAREAGTGLDGLAAQAHAAAQDAGGELEDPLTAAARDAGEQAGEEGGEALTDGLTARDAAVGLAAAALGAAFVAGFGQALEKGALTAELQGQLGATAADAERYGGIAGELYVSTLAETFEDGTQAIRNVLQSGLVPADATNEQLESISQKVLALARTFKLDLGMVTVAVGQMIRGGLVKDATEGLDLVARAFQINDQRADDMLDTLKEYTGHFSALGLDGKTSLGIVQQALDATGKDTDLAADAMKELRLRIIAMDAVDELADLGLDAKHMADEFAAGGPRAAAALDLLTDRVRAFPNQAERFRMAQKIMGTQSEDLANAFLAIDPSEAARKIGDFSGRSQEQVEALTQNSSAQLEQFKRNLQSKIVDVIGGEVIPALMDIGKFTANMWANVPEDGQTAIKVMGGMTLVLAGVTLSFGLAGRAAAAFQTWLSTLSTQATTTSAVMRGLQLSMGIVGVAMVAATTVMSLFGAANKNAKADSKAFAQSLKEDGGTIGKYTHDAAVAALETAGLGEMAAQAGIPLSRMADALLGVDGATEDVTARFKEYSDGIDYGTARQAAFELSLGEQKAALEAGKAELGRTEEAQKDYAEQTGDTTDAVEDQEKALDDLTKVFDELHGRFMNQKEAEVELEAAMDDLTASFRENGRTTDSGTEKGRANIDAILKAVKASEELTRATLEKTTSQEEANAVLLTQRARLADVFVQMGYTRERAAQLTDEYFRVPDNISTDVVANTSQARGAVAGVKADLATIPRTIGVRIEGSVSSTVLEFMRMRGLADGGILRQFADGGHVAQIARGNEIRVWNEPETGGEAYIPLAPSKRSRSTEILSQVAQDFGYQLAPVGGARSFADGGAVGGPGSAAGGQQAIRLELNLDRDGLIKVVRQEVATRGGNVQVVLGQRQR